MARCAVAPSRLLCVLGVGWATWLGTLAARHSGKVVSQLEGDTDASSTEFGEGLQRLAPGPNAFFGLQCWSPEEHRTKPVTLVAFDLDHTLTVRTKMPRGAEMLSSPYWETQAKQSFEPSEPSGYENRLEKLRDLLQDLATLEPRPALAVLTNNGNKLAARGVLELLHSADFDHFFDAIWSLRTKTIPKLAYREAPRPVETPRLIGQGQRSLGRPGTCKPVAVPCVYPFKSSCQNHNDDKENCLKVAPPVGWRQHCCQFVPDGAPAGWSFVDIPRHFAITKPEVLNSVTEYQTEWFPQLLQNPSALPMLKGLTIGNILLVDDVEKNFKAGGIELRGCRVVPDWGIGAVDPSDFVKLLSFVTAPDEAQSAVQEEETSKPEPASLEHAVGAVLAEAEDRSTDAEADFAAAAQPLP